jgi:hypothetical protein
VLGFIAAVPALLLQLISPSVTVAFSVLIFAVAAYAAWQIPKRIVVAAEKAQPVEEAELRSAGIVLAASAMGLLRAVVGFLTFQIAFWFRNEGTPTWWFGVVLVLSAVGTLGGNAIGPVVRQQFREERMLIVALGLTAIAGIVTAIFSGRATAALLAGVVGFSAAVARLAFDSIVQRDAPDANQGRAFAQFETKFQLAWVIGGLFPVIYAPDSPSDGRIGFAIVGFIALAAAASYIIGTRRIAAGKPIPEPFAKRARRQLALEMERRRARRTGSTPTTGTSRPLPPPSPDTAATSTHVPATDAVERALRGDPLRPPKSRKSS